MLQKKLNHAKDAEGKVLKEMMREEMTDMEDHGWSKGEKAGINGAQTIIKEKIQTNPPFSQAKKSVYRL